MSAVTGSDAYVLDYLRTPRGKGSARGALHGHSPVDLIVALQRALVERTGLDTEQGQDVVLGCASQVTSRARTWRGQPLCWPAGATGFRVSR